MQIVYWVVLLLVVFKTYHEFELALKETVREAVREEYKQLKLESNRVKK